MTTIFLSYARGDDEPFVRRLYDDLRANGFEVWFDRASMPSRQLKFLQEIRDAIAGHDRLLLVVGPKAVTSDYVNQEWQNALEMDKCVNPIVRLNCQSDDGGTVDGYALIPEELKLLHAEDFREDARYAGHLANLVRQLSDLAPPLGKLVAVPTLPLHYLAQRDRLLELRDALLIDLQRPVVVTGAAARVGVQGMGGIGKSVLAAALARDLEVRRAFPDGIFWVGVGQQANLVELQRGLAKELSGEALFNNLHAGKQKVKELLAERAALLVLDDVWQSSDANAFDVLGPRCKLLLTTRDAGLVSTMAATGYQVQLPTEVEALALLGKAARVPVESLPLPASEIVAECGRLPLALTLCGGMVQAGITWQDLIDALREHELEFLADEHALVEQHRNLWRAMEVSVRVLPEHKQQRFAELAVFQSGLKVPEAAAVVLWGHTGGLSERQARRLLVEFKQRSLVQLDRLTGAAAMANVSLHDLLHDFAVRLAAQLFGNLATLHNQLLEAYRKQCPSGWPSGPNDGYFFRRLRDHLIEAGRSDELVSTLLELKWLEAKAGNGLLFDLPADFSEALRVVRSDHPQRLLLPLIEEGLRRDIHFIASHKSEYLQALFQCLWNSCWWYDCPAAARHYDVEGPWSRPGPKVYELLEDWRAVRKESHSDSYWVRSLRPSPVHLGTAQLAVLRGPESVDCVAISTDGCKIVSGSYDKMVRLWDAASGEELRCLRGHEDEMRSVAISSDARRIISGSRDHTVRMWDAESGEELRCLRGHEASVYSVAISTDGRSIVSGSGDRTVRVWDAESGEELRCLRGHEEAVWSAAISSDGRRIISGSSDETLRVWDTESGEELRCLRGHEISVKSVAISSDGRRIVSGSHDKTVRVWEAESGKELHCLRGHEEAVHSVSISSDGRRVVSGSLDHAVRVWDAENGEELRCLRGHESSVTSVAISSDGLRIVSGSYDETVRVWNTESGEELRCLREHVGEVDSVTISSDGRRMVSGSSDPTIRVWDTESGEELRCLRHLSWAESITFSDDGLRIVSGSGDHTVRVWDTESGEELRCLRGHEDEVRSVAISRDGSRIVSGSNDKTLRVWDVASGEELRCLRGHESLVRSVAISRDRRRIVSGSGDHTVRVWDTESGEEMLCLRGHQGFVRSVAISIDGRRIVSGAHDNTVRVWDTENGEEMLCLRGHEDWLNSVAISPDGLRIVSRAHDNTVRVWDAESRECLETIEGWGDVQAIAGGAIAFPFRAIARRTETVIEDTTGQLIALFPLNLGHLATHPSGRLWAGASGNHVYVIALEGVPDQTQA